MDTGYNPFSLEGKTVLVTGASSGIGQATAIECSKMGASVIITGRNESKLAQTFESLSGEGHKQIILDLSTYESVQTLVEAVPTLNGVCLNAGVPSVKPISFITEGDLHKVLDINLNAPIYLTNLLVKKKKISKGGSIVFTSSISKFMPAASGSVYAASKGGLSAFMKGAALELAPKHIRCNAVLPGMIETAIMKGKETISEEQWEINKQLYLLKRFGTPEEVAWLIIYLLSDASSFMTGSEIVIDGGRSLK